MGEQFGRLITKNDENGLHSNLFCKAAPETLEEESKLFRISNINREECKKTFYNFKNFTREELKCIQKVHPHKKLMKLSLLQNKDSHSDVAGAHSQISSIRSEDQPRPSSHNQQFDPSTSSSKQKKEKVSRKCISSSAPARHALNITKKKPSSVLQGCNSSSPSTEY